MASLRLGSRVTTRSGDAGASRRAGAHMEASAEGSPANPARRTQKGVVDTSRMLTPTSSRPSAPGRFPQPPTTVRRPSASSSLPTTRPPLTHQTQHYGLATASSGSARSGQNLPPSSTRLQAKAPALDPLQSRNVLRRTPSALSPETSSPRNHSRNGSHRTSSSSSIPRSQISQDSSANPQLDRCLTESPAEIRLARHAEVTTAHTVTIYPELDRYRDVQPPAAYGSQSFELPHRIATQDLPPPTPIFSGTSSLVSGVSGSPSTRFSESPGPGPYSRDTTPTTSISSHSPGLVAPMRIPGPRMRPGARGRSGSFSHDGPNEMGGISADANPHTLAAIRESLTSSSSSSNGTVRGGDKKDKKKKKRLSPPPPSPPPRKSSQKFKKARDEEDSPSKPPREPAQPVMAVASPTRATGPVQSPAVTSPRAAPPRRPSRDGTPDLQSQLGLPMPIIHSNLSSTSLSERRASTTLGPAGLNRSVTPSSQPDASRRFSARLPTGREPTPAPRAEGRRQTAAAAAEPGRAARTPSPSVSTFKTRFPLFGRRTKTSAEAPPKPDKKEKPTRKGPAAGTGHEGYGRLGSHRRKSSTGSNLARGIAGTGSSQESLNSSQSYDPFFMDRMNPVVIAGGEIVENRNTSSELTRTESNQSFGFGRPSMDSRNASQVSLSSREGRNTLWPSAFPRSASQAPSLGSRRPSDSSDSEALAMKSTLAFRRSAQRLRSPDSTQLRLPKPIMVRAPTGVTSPSVNSLDTSVMSDDSALDPRQAPPASRSRKDAGATIAKKLTKRTRSPRRWNFFGRSQSQPAAAKPKTESSAHLAAAVKVVPVKQETKPVAFYTMMDFSEQEDADVPDVQEVLREAQVVETPLPRAPQQHVRRPSAGRVETPSSAPFTQPSSAPQPQELQHPAYRTAPTPVSTQGPRRPSGVTEAEPTVPRVGRPSRLPQVGRIPKVVSARPDQTSPKSFSRPFNRVSMLLPPRPQMLDVESLAKGPSPPKPSTPELTGEGSTLTGGTADSNSRYRLSREFSPDLDRVANEFLAFSPPRKGSECTSCTASSSSGILSFADATAVVPDANAPLVEDEIWDEYNDLIGEDHIKLPTSPRLPLPPSGLGRQPPMTASQAPESPTVEHRPTMSVDEIIDAAGRPPVASSIYSVDMTTKINDALEAYQKPLTPFSVSEFVSGYGDRTDSVDLGKKKSKSPRSSTSSSGRGARRVRMSNDSASSQASDDNSPLSQVNLRVGSMTVSKWLTFGHVLFSPARDELVAATGSLKRHAILVIDGLGNDDWSFYAAETYPEATFFNLSPRAPLASEHPNSSAFPLSPPNHHQIQYTSHMDKFPFAPESFTTVVFRFPSAAPEASYRNIISEARRVLKPGGYLELSILDLDLNNMGNRARRAVRRLKERIHAQAPDTNIGSTADLMLRLMGTKGFADVKSCRVGVPVVSPIAPGNASRSKRDPKARKDDRSLAEMMSDESPVADESITKMVAKVGRWWYSRCYEMALGANVNSLWSDRALLAECEEWRTSLKLMVCYARVPDIRRMASV